MNDKNNSRGLKRAHLRIFKDLFTACYGDVARALTIPKAEYDRDLLEVRNRSELEGIAFFTKVIPLLDKAVCTALSHDTPLDAVGFEKEPNGLRPKFLGALFREVFDANGNERSDASVFALGYLRQLLSLFYKAKLPYDEKDTNKIISSFMETDEEVGVIADNWEAGLITETRTDRTSVAYSPHRLDVVSRVAKSLIHRVLGSVNPFDTDLSYKHGPGAVATGEKVWEKPTFRRFYQKIAEVFNYEDVFYYNLTHLCDELESFMSLEELSAGTARVVLVPKDSRGPRLISCEPLEYQWLQQGLCKLMVKTIETHPLTQGLCNFADQSVNRELALKASRDGSMATLDMKDASDRISCYHVMRLFPIEWVRALMAARSAHTLLPGGQVVPLVKYAPMGSALCFPVEALTFWALSTATVLVNDAHRIPTAARDESYPDLQSGYRDLCPKYMLPEVDEKTTSSSVVLTLRRAGLIGRRPENWFRSDPAKRVYVYGDDIIVDSSHSEIVMGTLEAFGLKPNFSKCCTSGFFRESCGMDAYKGTPVTPVRLRTLWNQNLHGTSLFSWCEFHNHIMEEGYWSTGELIADQIRKVVPDIVYSTSRDVGYACLVDPRKTGAQVREINKFVGKVKRRKSPTDPQAYQIYTWVPRTASREAVHTGWAEMTRIASLKGTSRAPSGSLSPTDGPCNGFESELVRRYLATIQQGDTVRAYQYADARSVSRIRAWVAE